MEVPFLRLVSDSKDMHLLENAQNESCSIFLLARF